MFIDLLQQEGETDLPIYHLEQQSTVVWDMLFPNDKERKREEDCVMSYRLFWSLRLARNFSTEQMVPMGKFNHSFRSIRARHDSSKSGSRPSPRALELMTPINVFATPCVMTDEISWRELKCEARVSMIFAKGMTSIHCCRALARSNKRTMVFSSKPSSKCCRIGK